MQPFTHHTHGIGQVEVVVIVSGHLRLYVKHRVGEMQVIVPWSGYEELYRSTRVERDHGLMFHYVAVDGAVLSGGAVKRSSSLLTPSHYCLYTKDIVEFIGLTCLGRLSLTRPHAGGQKATQHVLTSIRDASFGCRFMLCLDKTS